MAQSVSYGWAQPFVTQLCKLDPFNIGFCLEADHPTRQYVVLALRGLEVRGAGLAGLTTLAHDLSRLPRREVIAQVWDQDPGSLTVLKKCPNRILPRNFYDGLMAIVTDEKRVSAIRHCKQLTPKLVTAVVRSDADLLTQVDPDLLTRLGGTDALRYIVDGVHKLRPDLDRAAIIQSLKALKNTSHLETWLAKLVIRLDLPPAPWDGTDRIVPVRSVRELRALGHRFQNCLGQYRWQGALKGDRAYYHCRGRPSAVACLVRDPLFNQWRLEEIRGRKNSAIRDPRYVETFASAGFPMLNDNIAYAIL
ncbi:hypothetical protein [Microvirga arabica]|uniref:hypothetical protein n=1 Tax=Microvirga arabica TaxID=1128671 RepID=UPI00193ABC7D|nr:hypothetical protein [Microvirga arabica]MBM1172841.1 hypothetical protein [Microvirga arabica]